METFMILGVGMFVAVGVAWEVDGSCFLSGFAISTKAMLGGVGVADFAQLENMRANAITPRQPFDREFTILSATWNIQLAQNNDLLDPQE